MKRKLTIEIDCDDKYCGECEHVYCPDVDRCFLFGRDLGRDINKDGLAEIKRHQICLDAEQKAKENKIEPVRIGTKINKSKATIPARVLPSLRSEAVKRQREQSRKEVNNE